MNRTDLLITLLGAAICITLGVMIYKSWIEPSSFISRHRLSRVLGLCMGLTLLWIYTRWENRG